MGNVVRQTQRSRTTHYDDVRQPRWSAQLCRVSCHSETEDFVRAFRLEGDGINRTDNYDEKKIEFTQSRIFRAAVLSFTMFFQIHFLGIFISNGVACCT